MFIFSYFSVTHQNIINTTAKHAIILLRRSVFIANRSQITVYLQLEQFLSDIGGTMGLWVGASVITLMELFYFVIWLIARCLKMDK